MARRRPRRKPRSYESEDGLIYEEDPDFIDEDDYYEENRPRRGGGGRGPASGGGAGGGTSPLVWLFPLAALLLLVIAVAFRMSDGGGGSGGSPEKNERYMPAILHELHRGQQLYWREVFDPKKKTRRFADRCSDVAFKAKRVIGAPHWPTRYARATSPEKAYRGYYFVDIGKDEAGQPFDYRKRYAVAAVPARYGKTGFKTFIVGETDGGGAGAVYSRDTEGRPPAKWPTDSEFRLEGGWQVE